MRKLFYVLFVLAVSLPAYAATITYTDSITGLFDLVADTDLVVPQFDTSLGTLNSITLTLSTALQGSLGFENLKKFTGGDFSVSASGTYAYLTLGINGSPIMWSDYSDSQTYTVTLAKYDGTIDYAGTSGTNVATFSDADTITIPIGPGETLFLGSGSVYFTIVTGSSASLVVPSNSAAIIDTTAQASVSVTYDYTPVPEPVTIAILGLGGLLFRRKVA